MKGNLYSGTLNQKHGELFKESSSDELENKVLPKSAIQALNLLSGVKLSSDLRFKTKQRIK